MTTTRKRRIKKQLMVVGCCSNARRGLFFFFKKSVNIIEGEEGEEGRRVIGDGPLNNERVPAGLVHRREK